MTSPSDDDGRPAAVGALPGVADPRRLEALRLTSLLDAANEPGFDALTRAVQLGLQAPTALGSLVDVDRQFFMASVGLLDDWARRRETPLSHSFCQIAVVRDEELVIEDARRDPRVAGNLAINELNVIAYAGVPLHTTDGHAIGTLCAIDHTPRRWRPDELLLLRALAATAAALIDARTDALAARDVLGAGR